MVTQPDPRRVRSDLPPSTPSVHLTWAHSPALGSRCPGQQGATRPYKVRQCEAGEVGGPR